MPLFVLAEVGGQEVLLLLAGQLDRCSKIRNLQDNARHMTSRRAHPAVTFFETLISKSFSLFVSSIKSIFSLSGQGSFFVCRFTFSFLSVSLSVLLSVFVCFFRGFHFESFLCRVLVPAISSFFQFRTVVRLWSVL
jgi:hypothetical protein